MRTVFSSLFSLCFLILLVLSFISCDNDADLVAEHVVLEQDSNVVMDKTLTDE